MNIAVALSSTVVENPVLAKFMVGLLMGGLFAAAVRKPMPAACVLICLAALMGYLMWTSQCGSADRCLNFALANASAAISWVLEEAATVLGWGLGYTSVQAAAIKRGTPGT